MDKAQILPILFFAVVIIIIVAATFFSKKAIVKRKLRNAPYKKISHFRNGEVAKFVGKVELVDSPLTAPLSKRKCSHYHVIVEQKVSSGKSSRWKTIIEETDSVKYVIRDAVDCAMIKTNHRKSYVVFDEKFSSGTFKDADANLESFLRKHGRKSEGFLGFNKTMRYREGVLEEGERVAVLGEGRWKEADEIGLPANYGRVLVVQDSEKHHVYLSDDPDTTNRDNHKNKYGRV